MRSASIDMESDYRKMSFWLETVPGSLEPRTSVQGDHHCDIAIVGAGYTGLWTAYYLNRHNPSLKISIIEAQIAGFGASGRNGGWCSAFLDGISHWIDEPAQSITIRDRGLHPWCPVPLPLLRGAYLWLFQSFPSFTSFGG